MKHAVSPERSAIETGLVHRLRNLQTEMAELVSSINQLQDVSPPDIDELPESAIKQEIALRAKREHFFEEGLFADPAWDIFLELYRTHLGQRKISVSSLCTAAAVPSTTALRWISKLESGGWIVKKADQLDARRMFVSLTPCGLAAMRRYYALVRQTTG